MPEAKAANAGAPLAEEKTAKEPDREKHWKKRSREGEDAERAKARKLAPGMVKTDSEELSRRLALKEQREEDSPQL